MFSVLGSGIPAEVAARRSSPLRPLSAAAIAESPGAPLAARASAASSTRQTGGIQAVLGRVEFRALGVEGIKRQDEHPQVAKQASAGPPSWLRPRSP